MIQRFFPRRLIALATLWFLSVPATGCSGGDCAGIQNPTMDFTVSDATTGIVICGATLRILASNYDEEFTICAGLDAGSCACGQYGKVARVKRSIYRVEASAPGYQSSAQTVWVKYGGCGPITATVLFKLQPTST